MVLMPLVKNFCSITLDLLSPSQTQAKTLFKSAWSRSDGFLMICEWWWDQKVWLQWGWAFLFLFFWWHRVVGLQCNGWMKTIAHTESLQWAKTLIHLFVGRGHQPCTQIINLPSNTLYISTWLTKRKTERPECPPWVVVLQLKCCQRSCQAQRGVFIWLSNQPKVSHSLILVSSFMENTAHLAPQAS